MGQDALREAEAAIAEAKRNIEARRSQDRKEEIPRSGSQMPAIILNDENARLVKTIEHYTFADGVDTVNFYVTFDKDLWNGASKFITDSQVRVESRAASLNIKLQDVPLSDSTVSQLAEWRLELAPLFSRVEATMTTYSVRNGKLSVKLYKSKSGAWKKGLKYS